MRDNNNKNYNKSRHPAKKDSYGSRDFKERRSTDSAESIGADSTNFDPAADESNGAVVGRNAVRELLKSGRPIDKIFVRRGDREGSITVLVAQAIERKIPFLRSNGRSWMLMRAVCRIRASSQWRRRKNIARWKTFLPSPKNAGKCRSSSSPTASTTPTIWAR